MKRILLAVAMAFTGSGVAASVFLDDYRDAENYFLDNPVRAGESATIEFEIDYCPKQIASGANWTACYLAIWDMSAYDKTFWSFSYLGSTGPSDLEQTYRFSVSFHPTEHILRDNSSGDDIFKLDAYFNIYLVYHPPANADGYVDAGDTTFDSVVWGASLPSLPKVPLPATATLLLLGLGALRVRQTPNP